MAVYSWAPGAAGDFASAANWLVNGAPATQPPGPNDFASIDGVGVVVAGAGTVQRLKFYGTANVSGLLTATYGVQVNQELTLDQGAVLTTPRLGLPIDGSQGGTCALTVGAQAVVAITPFHSVDNYGILIGDAGPPSATLLVQGAGAVVDGGNQPIAVGQGSLGTLTIADGGTVTAGNGDPLVYPWALVVGNHAEGTVNVSEATLTARGQIIVGRQANGTLTIAGCSVVAASDLYIGWTLQAHVSGKVSISGHRARLVIEGALGVGAALGTGSLDVANHAIVSAGLGVNVSATGTLTLDHGQIDTAALGVDKGGTLSGSGQVTAPMGFENNGGTITANGPLILVGDLSNDGMINADAGSELVCAGSLGGTGTITLDAGAVVSVAAVASSQTITFASNTGKLVLLNPGAFAGVIAGFVKGDVIKLHAPATQGTFVPGLVNGLTGGVLTLEDGHNNPVAQLSMIGTYATGSFSVTLGVVKHL